MINHSLRPFFSMNIHFMLMCMNITQPFICLFMMICIEIFFFFFHQLLKQCDWMRETGKTFYSANRWEMHLFLYHVPPNRPKLIFIWIYGEGKDSTVCPNIHSQLGQLRSTEGLWQKQQSFYQLMRFNSFLTANLVC